MAKYVIEQGFGDPFTIEVPEDAVVSVKGGYADTEHWVKVKQEGNTIAFYNNVKAVRCLDSVTRKDKEFA